MPELPEVETIIRGLRNKIVGKKLSGIVVRNTGSFVGDVDRVIGKTVIEVGRRGKLIVIGFEDDMYLTIHLKMTGQLIWEENVVSALAPRKDTIIGGHPEKSYMNPLPHKHTHLMFNFGDSGILYFNDMRKFGKVTVVKGSDLENIGFLTRLGPEPLSDKFTLNYLKEALLRHKKQPIKSFLLDQSNIAGLGNIYADEVLFTSMLLPDRSCESLSKSDIGLLWKSIRDVLMLAIKYGGSTARDYVNVDGQKGTYLDIANVYRRTGLPCKRCDGVVERLKIGGRSSHFCRGCQK